MKTSSANFQRYAPSPYLRIDRESKSITVMQRQEGSLFLARQGPSLFQHSGIRQEPRAKEYGGLYTGSSLSQLQGQLALPDWISRMNSYIAFLVLSPIEIFPLFGQGMFFFSKTGKVTQVPGATHLIEPPSLPNSLFISY